MIRKTSNNIKKPKFSRRIRSEVYLLLALYINRSITKKFPIETLLETIDSSVINPGEVEYDKQNWLKASCRKVTSKITPMDFPYFPMVHN